MRVYRGHHNIKCISYMYHYYCDHTCKMFKHYTLACIYIIMKAFLNVLINAVFICLKKLYHFLYLILHSHRHVSYMTHLF